MKELHGVWDNMYKLLLILKNIFIKNNKNKLFTRKDARKAILRKAEVGSMGGIKVKWTDILSNKNAKEQLELADKLLEKR